MSILTRANLWYGQLREYRRASITARVNAADLHNAANPFIRYLIGDLGSMAADDLNCPDGFPFRRLLQLQGRQQEFVHTSAGERLTLLYFAHSLKEFPWIDAFQIVQRTTRHLVIRIRCGRPITAEMQRQIEAQLRPKLVTARIDVEQVDELSRRPNGKVAVLVSESTSTSHEDDHAGRCLV